MDKLWYIQTIKCNSAIKRNELSSCEKTGGNLKYLLLSARSQYEKATCSTIPTTWHLERANYGGIKWPWPLGAGAVGGTNTRGTEGRQSSKTTLYDTEVTTQPSCSTWSLNTVHTAASVPLPAQGSVNKRQLRGSSVTGTTTLKFTLTLIFKELLTQWVRCVL